MSKSKSKSKPRHRAREERKHGSVLIGIRFGDNDFHATWRPLLASFIDSRFVDESLFTKARVVEIANLLSYGFYRLHQDSWLFERDERKAHITNYLKIDESKVYFGQECLDYVMNETSQHNGDFYYVDVEQRLVFSC